MARAAHQPNEKSRGEVEALAGFGHPHDDIATYLGITAKTLRKYYGRELAIGTIKANTQVARCLFQSATKEKSVAAQIFWLKARAGWREKQQVEVTGKDGDSLGLEIVIKDFSAPAEAGDGPEEPGE